MTFFSIVHIELRYFSTDDATFIVLSDVNMTLPLRIV